MRRSNRRRVGRRIGDGGSRSNCERMVCRLPRRGFSAKRFSGALTGHFSVTKHGDAVHEDGGKSFAEVVGVADFGTIRHGVWIKNHEVCDGADFDSSAVLNPEGVSRQASHFANGFFEEEGSVAADVLCEYSRIIAEAAWVGHGFAESARATIAGDHGHGVG